ncbi:cytidylate kinase [Formosa sp. Hel1_33_131]|uniref:(d)CMP kinase n=1 Tax=Formosa sp. Hel1_33_131 TaxID=1336794 RepID=UPI00084E2003|nr:(d)CMP kinase [Formosa sp. Hel1_33_131]AOR27157.1 cytidylate kinase [Formosa sp. Hel1_33_131]
MKKITIAIDGFSSTGKSTLAKQLAQKLQYVYVDSGAMYRAVALYTLQHKLIQDKVLDTAALINQLPLIKVTFQYNESLKASEIYLNGVNVDTEIRTMEVSNTVSTVAAVPEVRQQLVALQQQMGADKGIVMDGRDIGTVVFPDAELKLFMTASADTRAQRRYDELIGGGTAVTFEAVLENITSRDHIDSTREDSPLFKADDAIEIDNSNLSLEQQFEQVLALVNSKL